MSNKMHQDSEGNASSKRIAGLTAVFSGIGLLLVVGVVSIFREVSDPLTAVNCGVALTGIGSGLLAAGVVEKLGQNKTLVIPEVKKEEEEYEK